MEWSAWCLLVPVAIFVALAVRHDRVIRARDRSASLVGFYERGLARIEDRWPGSGATGDRYRNDHHLYANDLDLFGQGSLFELLSIARTRAGEDVLAAWLKTAADRAEISERQYAIAELTPSLDFRESIAVVGSNAAALRSDWLAEWGHKPPLLS